MNVVDFHTENITMPPVINNDLATIQVVITELILNNGIIEFTGTKLIYVEENIGSVKIPVLRRSGFDSSVGIHYEVIFNIASTEDIIQRDGALTFGQNETLKYITINIIDDGVPELIEDFSVKLTKPLGGVTIGNENEVIVYIKANDYPYGLFG